MSEIGTFLATVYDCGIQYHVTTKNGILLFISMHGVVVFVRTERSC